MEDYDYKHDGPVRWRNMCRRRRCPPPPAKAAPIVVSDDEPTEEPEPAAEPEAPAEPEDYVKPKGPPPLPAQPEDEEDEEVEQLRRGVLYYLKKSQHLNQPSEQRHAPSGHAAPPWRPQVDAACGMYPVTNASPPPPGWAMPLQPPWQQTPSHAVAPQQPQQPQSSLLGFPKRPPPQQPQVDSWVRGAVPKSRSVARRLVVQLRF